MKKTNIFIGVGILIIIIGGWLIFPNQFGKFIPQKEIKILEENINKEIILVIDDGQGFQRTFKADFKDGMNAFDLLKEGTIKLDLALKTKNYENLGVLIEAIGEIENGQDGQYWFYYVNKEAPMVAADKNLLKPGDNVEFKFEKSSF